MTSLERLIAEREPDPEVLERERLSGSPRPYKDPRFYEPLEHLLIAGITAVLRDRDQVKA